MVDLTTHRREQLLAASSLGETARLLGVHALSSSTVAAASSLVGSVFHQAGGVPLDQAAGDVKALRNDVQFNVSLAKDLSNSQNILTGKMLHSLEAGFESEMVYQKDNIPGLTSEVTAQDRADMKNYPLQGHTCAEISQYVHNAIRYEVTGLLGLPLVGGSAVATLPDQLGELAQRFGRRCALTVEEAYFAGIQMALRGVATALAAM